jgi:hypothetical protein
MIPINNNNRSPREFRAGIPPGLPQYMKILMYHNLQNSRGVRISDILQIIQLQLHTNTHTDKVIRKPFASMSQCGDW